MAQNRNKYAFDREYYENLAKNVSYDGNAARKLDVAPLEEDLWEDEEAYAYEESADIEEYKEEETESYEETVQETQKNTGKARKTKYVVRFNLFKVAVIAGLFGVLTGSAVYMLRLQSDLVQTNKMIASAEAVLADAEALNCSLRTKLDTNLDRNYIYNVAVGRLGMVYPDNNKIATYEVADPDYVRQYGQFR